jgi:hypothetical protein
MIEDQRKQIIIIKDKLINLEKQVN